MRAARNRGEEVEEPNRAKNIQPVGLPRALAGRQPMSLPAKDSSRKSDSELLIAIAAGNRRALEELYLGYQRRLARFLSRVTRRHDNVEEIINDTFMVVWCNANDFRFASQVSSWIFSIAYRTALKSIRRQQNHSAARSLEECPEQTVDPVLETEIKDWVTHGLNRLPDEQRLALELACHMGLSLMEIAEITGAPIGTVKARMFHARQKLRRYLPTLGGGGYQSDFERRNRKLSRKGISDHFINLNARLACSGRSVADSGIVP
jgi:RNA polymerase sigma-70 factor (ECF subfamily)